MENDEEVDIGTVRDMNTSSWTSPLLHTDFGLSSSPNTLFKSLASSSAPDIAGSTLSDYPDASTTLTRLKVSPHSRHKSGTASDPDLSAWNVDKISRVQRWVFYLINLSTVDFDLDVGPVLDCLYPPLKLSSACRENIAFSSFPDSSIFDTGSQIHSFKLGLGIEDTRPSVVYGHSCFMQRRDSASKRGYLQRSVVILSHHPFPSLFEEMVSILAPLHLSHGCPVLESACQNIASWPDVSLGSSLVLDFLGHTLQASFPQTDDELQFPQALENINPRSHILASVPSPIPSPLAVFSSCLPSLWSIWELLILSEPVLIFGPSPRTVSLAVWWLRDLIRPIPLSGDFRPYITIHDQDYATLINKHSPKPGLVIGVTNPFILSMTKHWPNILSLGWGSKNIGKSHMPGSGHALGLVSQNHKRFTSKDRPLLKIWERSLDQGGHLEYSTSQDLRRHFSSRTASFFVPLSRYINSLIPSPAEAAAASKASPRTKLRLKPFNNSHFLTSLKTHGTPLPFRSSTKQREFYKKWLRTPAFAAWLAGQEEVVMRVLASSGS